MVVTIIYHGCYNLVNNVVTTMHVTSLQQLCTQGCHQLAIFTCMGVYVRKCVHVHIVHSLEPETDRKKTSDVVDNTSGCIHTLLLWLASTLPLFQPNRHHPSVLKLHDCVVKKRRQGKIHLLFLCWMFFVVEKTDLLDLL